MKTKSPYPAGLTGESAFYAADGPREQAIAELTIIAEKCKTRRTPESRALQAEARMYLEWLEDHESCADMPED